MPIPQRQGPGRGLRSSAMARMPGGAPQQVSNHTARQIIEQYDQEYMAREPHTVFIPSPPHAHPDWCASVQPPPLEVANPFPEDVNPFQVVGHGSFLHSDMYLGMGGRVGDDQFMGAVGHTHHHNLSTPESYARQVELKHFLKVARLTFQNL